jgi:broad specificity phosphatase PhoE
METPVHRQSINGPSPGGELHDIDRRAQSALASAATHPARRPVFVSHEMMGRMLQRHLLGLDAREAVGFRHRHDVVFAIAPRTSARRELRPAF